MKEPQTRKEWQEAVNLAWAGLSLDSARLYGLLTGGPKFDVQRCVELLRRGEEIGIRPANDAVERFIEALFDAKTG